VGPSAATLAPEGPWTVATGGAQRNPWGVLLHRIRPGGAEDLAHTHVSIEHMRFVEFDAVRPERTQEFGLEIFGFVMLGLPHYFNAFS
jgi:hypothetical protein